MTKNAEAAPSRRITGFHRDEEGHWVAELECGHGQHVRHTPPWQNRSWTTTEDGRRSRIGTTLECRKCIDPPTTRSPSQQP